MLIDYKGGSTFDACADLPHTVGVVTDLDDRLAERALISLEAEIRRRERLLRDGGADDLDAYRSARPAIRCRARRRDRRVRRAGAELPGFLTSLVGVAQRGRSLGIHLVLATQRPAGVVSDEIRANTNLRIALRLQDRADAIDIVGAADPAAFPAASPGGRCSARAGETVVFQTADSSGFTGRDGGALRVSRLDDGRRVPVDHRPEHGDQPRPTELAAADTLDPRRGVAVRRRPPFRPWLEAAPDGSRRRRLEAGAVGLVDEPAGQRQVAAALASRRGQPGADRGARLGHDDGSCAR